MSTRTLKQQLLIGTVTAVFMSNVAFAKKLPDQSFDLARAAIEEAQEVDADRVASSELSLAESKFQEAIEYNNDGKDKVAQRLLDQSMLHAEHAELEGMQAKADVAFNEVNAALRSLELEIARP
ncbi:MAG: DUF4398 domain-containing protein [Pseudomonadota bacterium]